MTWRSGALQCETDTRPTSGQEGDETAVPFAQAVTSQRTRAHNTMDAFFFLFSVLELATCANLSLLPGRRGEQRVSSNGRIRKDRAAHLLDAGE